jgi:hypothetical protein
MNEIIHGQKLLLEPKQSMGQIIARRLTFGISFAEIFGSQKIRLIFQRK